MLTSPSPLWHPFTQMKDAGNFPMVVSADGCRLKLAGGATLIDAISSWWVITHGHCCAEIVAAIREQVGQLDQVIFAGFTHPKAEALAERLMAVTPPSLTRAFFSDDGSTAVEVALKMAIQSCRQRGWPQRNLFLAFEHAYHGDTVGAMSVGGESVFNQAYSGMMFRVIRAAHPSKSGAGANAFLADFIKKIECYGDRLAGVIVEPLVQGAGGMIVWPEEALRRIGEITREQGIYLIFDEVMTGFGRTGALFAMEKLGMAPDLVCLSKGLTGGMLPLSVTLASEPIYASFLSDDRAQTFFHGHSFTANPISCAAAHANLELCKSLHLAEQWRRIEAVHLRRLSRLRHPEILEDARHCGTIAAVEIKNPTGGYLSPIGPLMYRHALAEGVLLRPLGNVLYILPPYCMEDDELDRCWDVLESCLDLAAEHF